MGSSTFVISFAGDRVNLNNRILSYISDQKKDRKKFGNREAGFTHGGINIEEVIVPFVEVIVIYFIRKGSALPMKLNFKVYIFMNWRNLIF